MFITNVVINDYILERSFFTSLKEATEHAKELSKEKIWKLPNDNVFFGDVEVKIYNPDLRVVSNHRDEHILSFIDSFRDR
jgi:hypothetical protein